MLEEEDDDDLLFLTNHETRPSDAIIIVEQKYQIFPDFLLCFLKLATIGTTLHENLVQDNENHNSPPDHFLPFTFLSWKSTYHSTYPLPLRRALTDFNRLLLINRLLDCSLDC